MTIFCTSRCLTRRRRGWNFPRSKENRERVRTAAFLPKLVNLLKMSRHLLKNSLVKQKTIQLTINVATSNPTNKLLLQRVRYVAPMTVHLRVDRRLQPTPTRKLAPGLAIARLPILVCLVHTRGRGWFASVGAGLLRSLSVQTASPRRPIVVQDMGDCGGAGGRAGGAGQAAQGPGGVRVRSE
jgi:hypothetical protein